MKEEYVHNTFNEYITRIGRSEPDPVKEPNHPLFVITDKRLYQPEKWDEVLEELRLGRD